MGRVRVVYHPGRHRQGREAILAERASARQRATTRPSAWVAWLRDNADLAVLSALLVATATFGRPFSKVGLEGVLYVTEVAILLVAGLALVRVGLRHAFQRVRETVPLTLLALLWVAGTVAALRGLGQHGFRDVIQDIGLVEYSIFLPIVAVVVDTRERLLALMRVLMAAGIAAAFAFAVVANAAPGGALGTEHNPTAAVGIYLSLAMLIVAARFTHAFRVHPLLLGAAAAAAVLMSVTVTRGVTVAALTALVVLVALAPRGQRVRAVALGLAFAMLAVFGSNPYHAATSRIGSAFSPPPAVDTTTPPAVDTTTATVTAAIRESFDPTSPSGMNANVRWRIAYWKFVIEESAEAPLLGTGFGHAANFRWSNILYDARVGNAADPNDVTPPHNSFLNVLYRTGLLGFIPLVALVGVAVWRTARELRRPLSRERRALLVGFASLLAFVIVIANFNVALEGPYMGMFFWTILALLLLAPRGATREVDGAE